jgi:hypothetical protein
MLLNRDTIYFGVNVVFPPDSSYNSFSISFDNEMGKLSFLGIDTTHTLVGNAGWNLEYENDVNLKIFSENNQLPISGEGILLKLDFSIPDTLHWGDLPLNINSITFDDSDHEVEITNGNLFIKRIIVYGDVNLDSVVSDSDAVMILKYLLNEEIFNEQQLLNADVSLKSGVSALDASLILQYNAGVIDTLPYELFNDSILTDCVFKMDPDSVRLGAQISVPIFTESSENIFSFSGRFEYDQSYLNLNEVVWYDTNETFIFVEEHSTDKVNFVGAGRSALGIRDIFATMEFTANETFYYIYTYVDLERMRMNEQSVTYNIARAVIWKDITGIADINLPEFVALDENYPNPLNPTTTISYDLPEAQNIKLQVFDITGRLVETLYSGYKEAGHWDVTWNAGDQSSGIYIYRLQVGDQRISRKMLLLK